MRRFKGECAHFSFSKCHIYTHDGASANFSINSHETDNSVADFANFTPAPDKYDQHYLFTFLSQLVLALTGASLDRNKVFEHFFKIRNMVSKIQKPAMTLVQDYSRSISLCQQNPIHLMRQSLEGDK
jgi:hypothetical protein